MTRKEGEATSSSTTPGVTVLAPAADALGGPEGSTLHASVRDLAAPAHVVVDLGAVRHVNSSGLGMLLAALTTARGGGGDLRLAAPSSRVVTLLAVTRLDGTFRTFDTVDAAVASFDASAS